MKTKKVVKVSLCVSFVRENLYNVCCLLLKSELFAAACIRSGEWSRR